MAKPTERLCCAAIGSERWRMFRERESSEYSDCGSAPPADRPRVLRCDARASPDDAHVTPSSQVCSAKVPLGNGADTRETASWWPNHKRLEDAHDRKTQSSTGPPSATITRG